MGIFLSAWSLVHECNLPQIRHITNRLMSPVFEFHILLVSPPSHLIDLCFWSFGRKSVIMKHRPTERSLENSGKGQILYFGSRSQVYLCLFFFFELVKLQSVAFWTSLGFLNTPRHAALSSTSRWANQNARINQTMGESPSGVLFFFFNERRCHRFLHAAFPRSRQLWTIR